MPNYIYACDDCRAKTEATHPMNSEVTVCCSKCGSDRTHRVPQIFNAVYAIEGFYHTDSGKRFESQLSEKGKDIWRRKKAELGVA